MSTFWWIHFADYLSNRRQVRQRVLLKLRSHMRGAVAERRRADFEIPAPLPWICSHIRGADAGGSAISWGQWWFGGRGFEADTANWVLDPFLAERFLLPLRHRSATAHVWTHVMICVEANFPPASAHARPHMCERTFMHFNLKVFHSWEGVIIMRGQITCIVLYCVKNPFCSSIYMKIRLWMIAVVARLIRKFFFSN